MGPEAKRAARLALNRPQFLHLFSGFRLGMLGTQLQKSGPGLRPTRALGIAWEVCLGCLGTSLA